MMCNVYGENKISECIYPYIHGCYDCEYNMIPGTFDGGCKRRHLELLDKDERDKIILHRTIIQYGKQACGHVNL